MLHSLCKSVPNKTVGFKGVPHRAMVCLPLTGKDLKFRRSGRESVEVTTLTKLYSASAGYVSKMYAVLVCERWTFQTSISGRFWHVIVSLCLVSRRRRDDDEDFLCSIIIEVEVIQSHLKTTSVATLSSGLEMRRERSWL